MKDRSHYCLSRVTACSWAELGVSSDDVAQRTLSPAGKIFRPINGKDLTRLTTWLRDSGTKDPHNDYMVDNGNGITVNGCYNVYPSSGKILLQNEGDEIYCKNVELRAFTIA